MGYFEVLFCGPALLVLGIRDANGVPSQGVGGGGGSTLHVGDDGLPVWENAGAFLAGCACTVRNVGAFLCTYGTKRKG